MTEFSIHTSQPLKVLIFSLSEAAHVRLKDLKLHDPKFRFLMSQLKYPPYEFLRHHNTQPNAKRKHKTYRKTPKYSDTQNICCNHPKTWTRWLYRRVMHPKDAAGIANSVDPDQTAPLGAVWSGSALFAQTYLSENLGSLQ